MERAIIKLEDGKQYCFQNENELPNGKYIVTYFKLSDNGSDLEQLVDYEITKEQIIENVNAQRYVEGADYFLMEQLKTKF